MVWVVLVEFNRDLFSCIRFATCTPLSKRTDVLGLLLASDDINGSAEHPASEVVNSTTNRDFTFYVLQLSFFCLSLPFFSLQLLHIFFDQYMPLKRLDLLRLSF